MGKVRVYQHAFNTGVQDKTALARIDLERMRLAAEEQTNFIGRATGPGFVRPGLEYLTATRSNLTGRIEEFIFGATDAALLEFTNGSLRILVDDELVSRPSVSTAVTTSDFSSSAGWTSVLSGDATATFGSGLTLNAVSTGGEARVYQEVTVASGDQGVRHALAMNVTRGPVIFRCGSTLGGDDYIAETTLRTGLHSLAFTPTGNFFIQFFSNADIDREVSTCAIAIAGVMVLSTPWPLADLNKIRLAQSADVVFVACDGYQQRRIERRDTDSWSVVLYQVDDGPFLPSRTAQVKLKVAATHGNTTLTSDKPFFTPDHVGALFRLFSDSTVQTFSLGAESTFTQPIRVTGVFKGDATYSPAYNDRGFTYTVSGTWVGTLRVSRSYDGEEGPYIRFRRDGSAADIDITANASYFCYDEDSNAIIHYRIGFETGSYTSGVADIAIAYGASGGYGICRVTGFTDSQTVSVEVLRPFKNVAYTENWREGEWSAAQNYPSAVAFSDGRLWWSGLDRLWGSISDDFESFNEDEEGDAGPIARSIATGGINDTQWMMALQRLIIGTEGAVAVAKSSSLDEPLTPTNLTIKDSSSIGVAPVDPAKIDARGIVVERAGTALMEVTFDGASGDYLVTQLSKLTTDPFAAGIKSVALQRRPDTRLWVINNDGSCVCVVYEPAQEVLAFIPITTEGFFDSVAVLPADEQDRVYFIVARGVDGATVRYIEKMALDTDVRPTTTCKVMDSFVEATNSPASVTVSGLDHLIGETVVAWADGAPVETSQGVRQTFTVSASGTITLSTVATNVVVGLPYRTRYKSARLAYGAEGGTAMLQKKKINEIGFIATDYTRFGLKYGQSFDRLYPLPQNTNGSPADAIVLSDMHDETPFTFGGSWSTDSRVHFEINSPYTATILGMILQVETNG